MTTIYNSRRESLQVLLTFDSDLDLDCDNFDWQDIKRVSTDLDYQHSCCLSLSLSPVVSLHTELWLVRFWSRDAFLSSDWSLVDDDGVLPAKFIAALVCIWRNVMDQCLQWVTPVDDINYLILTQWSWSITCDVDTE